MSLCWFFGDFFFGFCGWFVCLFVLVFASFKKNEVLTSGFASTTAGDALGAGDAVAAVLTVACIGAGLPALPSALPGG